VGGSLYALSLEPSTLDLYVLGGLALLMFRRRR
jgi:hypothetical protein